MLWRKNNMPDHRIQIWTIAARCLSLFSLCVGLLSLIGYLTDMSGLTTWGKEQQMALPTCVAFICNAIAINLICLAIRRNQTRNHSI